MLIFTDLQTDVDDVGAIAMAGNTNQRVYGLISTTNNSTVGQSLMVLDKYYELNANIGLDKNGETFVRDPYTRQLSSEFEQGKDRVIGANRAARRSLKEARRNDEKIEVVSIGSLNTLSRFLSKEKNRNLIKDTVTGLTVMGGDFETGASEFNIRLNPNAANVIANQWPTKVTFAGFELGRDILTGQVLNNRPGPTRSAYQLYPAAGGTGIIGNTRSYDKVAMTYALGRRKKNLIESNNIRLSFSSDGSTNWRFDDNWRSRRPRKFLISKNNEKITSFIERRLF